MLNPLSQPDAPVSCFECRLLSMFTSQQPLSCMLIICASFLLHVCYTSAKSYPFPPKRRNFGTSRYPSPPLSRNSQAHGRNLRMLWILILLELTFASVMSTKINTSILKTFAKETNVFDEKTKNSISFGKHLLDWREQM